MLKGMLSLGPKVILKQVSVLEIAGYSTGLKELSRLDGPCHKLLKGVWSSTVACIQLDCSLES